MTKNMGTTDRVLRTFVVAPALVVLGVVLGPTAVVSWVLYALAAVMVLTSSVSFCPLYAPFGIRTCPRETAGSDTTPVSARR